MAWNQTVACGHVIDASENQKENHMLVLITFFIWRKRRLDLDQDELGEKVMIDHAWRLEPVRFNVGMAHILFDKINSKDPFKY